MKAQLVAQIRVDVNFADAGSAMSSAGKALSSRSCHILSRGSLAMSLARDLLQISRSLHASRLASPL